MKKEPTLGGPCVSCPDNEADDRFFHGDAEMRIEQVIAFVSDLQVARAAYAAAVKAKPGKRITLRQRACILDKSF